MPGMMAVAVLTLVFSSSVCADIYTWTDALGVVHFTDTPPPDRPHRPVEVVAPVTVPMAENLQQHRRISAIREQVQGMLSSDRKEDSARNKSKEKMLAQQNKTCASYRRELAKIQAQLRSGYGNSKGNSLRHKRRNVSQALSRECILR
ncbi:DUF4124 domain-containing protein [Marinobacter sp. 1_MG-2023]|uniref:DUF4124 domain-containing protein n=1 Tax=Marinobacter sp. 1_MG-2023 TaxID=3062627 RepID=UPI0026E1C872|nr:DUF4124 domain-containing protein [Marinobacter sp. 1_MG-2023]MDO6822615.1 DUF4124 domain-containing protein [Marinobacter sp. 1_MG-2023]